jgi:hypothetical protein
VVVDRGIAPHPDHLPHRRVLGVGSGDVGLLPACHVEGDERVAVDVGVDRDSHGLDCAD